jgi:hypothetical protein
MAVLGYDGSAVYDSAQWTYDGLFLGGMLRLDDLLIPVKHPRLTDPRWPGDTDPRGYMTGWLDEERTYWI